MNFNRCRVAWLTLAALLWAVGMPVGFAYAGSEVSAQALDESTAKGVEFLAQSQSLDGSWTRRIITSSVMYNTHMIFLYEFIEKIREKSTVVDGLMRFVWSEQNADGGMPGYRGGKSDSGVSILAYLAAKIAGEADEGPRMALLEGFIHKHGGTKHAFQAFPYLMAFGIDSDAGCIPGFLESWLLRENSKLPWIRVMLYPLLHIMTTGQTHRLDVSRYPSRLGKTGACPRWMPHPFRKTKKDPKFWRWMDANLNEDGTLFDYTPTSVPGLMALSTGGSKYADLLDKGVKTLESFQIQTENGIYQSPGEASIGETNGILNTLIELGYSEADPQMGPVVQKAESFLWRMQQASGGFGFSKHNIHFPDSDDTSNSIYVLKRLALLRGHGQTDAETTRRLDRALSWLLTLQNKDGGFGTWERDRMPVMTKLLHRMAQGLVLSESVTEHTARIVVMLALFKDQSPKYARAYQKALQYLLVKQLPDGSYPGTWFVDYLFGTSMVIAALGTTEDGPAVRKAVEKGLGFILSRQALDGGFSESPDSFEQRRSLTLAQSSPAQTGLIIAQLLTFEREEKKARWPVLELPVQRAVEFLLRAQQADGLWHDPTWTGVTFPKVEYLIYPYIQEIGAIQTIGMFREMVQSKL